MANDNIELLRGDPKQSLWKLSIPIMVTMIVTSLYNIIDGMWIVGLGSSTIAGIGIITPLWTIINGVATGLGNGTTSSISRFREEYGDEKANAVGSQSIIISLASSIILTIVLFIALFPFLNAYNIDADTTKAAVDYSIPLFIGLFGFVLSYDFAGILRAEGDTKRSMYALSFGLILNAALDPIFIYILKMGSAGASLSTIITSLISAIIMYYWIFVKKDTYISIDIKGILKSKWDWIITKDILSTGIPASAVLFVLSFSSAMFYYFINIMGTELGVSIFSSGNRIYILGLMPITSMCSALVAIIGTHYGAGNIKYVKRAHTYCTLYTTIVGVIVCALFIIFSDQLAGIFLLNSSDDSLIIGISHFIKITSLCIPFLGLGLPSTYIYQGLGKGIYSLCWTTTCEVICTIPATYFFAFIMHYGLMGIWIGFVVGRGTACILNVIGARYSIRKLEKSNTT